MGISIGGRVGGIGIYYNIRMPKLGGSRLTPEERAAVWTAITETIDSTLDATLDKGDEMVLTLMHRRVRKDGGERILPKRESHWLIDYMIRQGVLSKSDAKIMRRAYRRKEFIFVGTLDDATGEWEYRTTTPEEMRAERIERMEEEVGL